MMLKELPLDISVKANNEAPIAIAIAMYMDFEDQMKNSLTKVEYQAYLAFVSTITKHQINFDDC